MVRMVEAKAQMVEAKPRMAPWPPGLDSAPARSFLRRLAPPPGALAAEPPPGELRVARKGAAAQPRPPREPRVPHGLLVPATPTWPGGRRWIAALGARAARAS